MTQLLVLREHLQTIYQKYDFILKPLLRFLVGWIVFSSVNRLVGYNAALNNIFTELLLALVGIFMPGSVLMAAAAIFTVVHIYYVSKMIALVVAAIFLLFYFGYAKFVPKYAYIILMIPITIPCYLVYGIPIFLGLTATPAAVAAVICGVGSYYLLQTVTSVVSTSSDMGISLYHTVLEQFITNREMYVTIAVFSIVIVVVYILRNCAWNYAFEIAVIVGTVSSTMLFIVINYLLDFNMDMAPFLVGTVVSSLVVWALQFMRLALNYTGVERLQFEDEEYYYYVRAVPKMNVAAPSKRIKKINARHFAEHTPDADEKKEEQL